jgi:hypothetical protein
VEGLQQDAAEYMGWTFVELGAEEHSGPAEAPLLFQGRMRDEVCHMELQITAMQAGQLGVLTACSILQVQCLHCEEQRVHVYYFGIVPLPVLQDAARAADNTVIRPPVELVTLEQCLKTLLASPLEWNGCPAHSRPNQITASQDCWIDQSPKILWLHLNRWRNDMTKQDHKVCRLQARAFCCLQSQPMVFGSRHRIQFLDSVIWLCIVLCR